jgi:hypothetical protein
LIWIVHALELYLALGFVFAVLFVSRGAATIDPSARAGTIGFKLLIFPGVVSLWPLLARRWIRARSSEIA